MLTADVVVAIGMVAMPIWTVLLVTVGISSGVRFAQFLYAVGTCVRG